MSAEGNVSDGTYEVPLRAKPVLELLLYTISVSLFIYVMWYSYSRELSQTRFAIAVLGVHLVYWGIFKSISVERGNLHGKIATTAYIIYSVISIIPTVYFFVNYDDIATAYGTPETVPLIMGSIIFLQILIAITIISRLISIITIFSLVYLYFGPYFPGFTEHAGIGIQRMVTMNTIELDGIYGQFLILAATWVLMFMYVAGFLQEFGGMYRLVNGAKSLMKESNYLRLGQVSVLASMGMGSINGSTAANTATTGSFTIPMLKGNDYPGRFASAIESVASCGGQILPPIMGAAAFIMASFIEPTYGEIIIAATIPAILFFLTVATTIELLSSKYGIERPKADGTQNKVSFVKAVKNNFEYIIPFLVLIYTLAYLQYSPMSAGMYTIFTLIALKFIKMVNSVFKQDMSDKVEEVPDFGRSVLEGTKAGIEFNLDLIIMFVALAIVVRAFSVTGLSLRLSMNLIAIAGGSLILLLVLTMIASVFFGMAVGTTAAYLLAAILVAPALTEFGIEPLQAHFFVFISAISAGITPPIAIAVIIASRIAESDFWSSCVESVKIGFPIFLLPYIVIFVPEILSPNFIGIISGANVLIAFIGVGVGLAGYIGGEISLKTRLVFLTISAVILYATSMMWLIGILPAALLVALILYFANLNLERLTPRFVDDLIVRLRF